MHIDSAMGENKGGDKGGRDGSGAAVLKERVVREDLPEKVTLKQSLEGSKSELWIAEEGEHSKQREHHVQRPKIGVYLACSGNS